jgi:hypothetical protein
MKVCAVMMTEGRAQIAPIAFASFAAQQFDGDAELHVDLPYTQRGIYQRALTAPTPTTQWYDAEQQLPEKRRTSIVGSAFMDYSVDVVTIWDDDDYSPPRRLAATCAAVALWHPRPVVVSYTSGFFVNARTLQGSKVEVPHLWGGCLTFNRAAFRLTDGFRTWPGEDRDFVRQAERRGAKVVEVTTARDEHLPVAFIHGRNTATHPRSEQVDLEPFLRRHMPPAVFSEVKRFQAFCIERRVFPPGG